MSPPSSTAATKKPPAAARNALPPPCCAVGVISPSGSFGGLHPHQCGHTLASAGGRVNEAPPRIGASRNAQLRSMYGGGGTRHQRAAMADDLGGERVRGGRRFGRRLAEEARRRIADLEAVARCARVSRHHHFRDEHAFATFVPRRKGADATGHPDV